LGYHKHHHANSELTLTAFKDHLSPYVKQLEKVLFCGTLGEPAAAQELLPMIRWIKDMNPSTVIGINTNGGLRTTDWWIELASLIKDDIRSYVVFSIDGLEDTNHIYRKKVNWSKLIKNVKAYIGAGGNAQWDGLIFKHNQHQINHMRDLAQQLGFKAFRTKVSSRENFDDILPPDHGLPEIKQKPFSCMAQSTGSLYLSAQGLWYPCCYIHHHSVLGGSGWGSPLRSIDSRDRDWQQLAESLSTDARPSICTRSCGTSHNVGQWTHEETF
jgi:hypothetical protein